MSPPDSGAARSLKGYLLLGLAVVTCPCHLPIVLAVPAGTGLAAAVSQHLGLVALVMSAMFTTSLWLGLQALKTTDPTRSWRITAHRHTLRGRPVVQEVPHAEDVDRPGSARPGDPRRHADARSDGAAGGI